MKYNRSEWGRGKAMSFKTIGRGFVPRQSLSFSHGDVGVYLPPALSLFHT